MTPHEWALCLSYSRKPKIEEVEDLIRKAVEEERQRIIGIIRSESVMLFCGEKEQQEYIASEELAHLAKSLEAE